jgi:hypothetical protein
VTRQKKEKKNRRSGGEMGAKKGEENGIKQN